MVDGPAGNLGEPILLGRSEPSARHREYATSSSDNLARTSGRFGEDAAPRVVGIQETINVAGQKVRVGRVHARKVVQVLVEETT